MWLDWFQSATAMFTRVFQAPTVLSTARGVAIPLGVDQ
jgi:hypothetical protein